jgi:hypothetical protein
MDGWMDGWMDGRTDGLMDGWMDGSMDEWTDGPQMDGWNDRFHLRVVTQSYLLSLMTQLSDVCLHGCV